MWRTLPGMAVRLVLNRVVQGRSSTACTRLGSNRWMVSVRSRLGFVHVDVFWGSLCVNRSSAVNDLSVVPVYKVFILTVLAAVWCNCKCHHLYSAPSILLTRHCQPICIHCCYVWLPMSRLCIQGLYGLVSVCVQSTSTVWVTKKFPFFVN